MNLVISVPSTESSQCGLHLHASAVATAVDMPYGVVVPGYDTTMRKATAMQGTIFPLKAQGEYGALSMQEIDVAGPSFPFGTVVIHWCHTVGHICRHLATREKTALVRWWISKSNPVLLLNLHSGTR